MMGAVFAMQGLGQLAAAFVMLFVTLGFKESLKEASGIAVCTGDCQVAVDKMWRTLIGFGAVPACIALYCELLLFSTLASLPFFLSSSLILLFLPSSLPLITRPPCLLCLLLTFFSFPTVRLTIPETPRYTFDVARDVEKAQDDVKAYMVGKHEGEPDEVARATINQAAKEQLEVPKASWSDFGRHYAKRKNWMLLLGTAGSWFCLDVAFYGLSLNNAQILDTIGFSSKNTHNVYEILYNTAIGNMIIVLAGAVPGYWVAVATIDTIGRKTIQLGGFIILTILFIAMGFSYHHLSSNALLAIYVLAQFFFNFGTSCPLAESSMHLSNELSSSRPQHDHLHRPRRSVPHPLPFHLPRYLGRVGQDWLHHRSGRHFHAAHPRRHHQEP